MANLFNENAPAQPGASSSNTLSAFFDSRSDAESAVQKLKDAGISDDKVRFVPGYESDEARNNVASDDRGGFWHSLSSFFFADDDRATYAEGLRRGGFLVSVSDINDADYETAHDILDDDGAIDIDERADQWRTEGWDSNAALAASTYDRKASTEVGVPSTAKRDDTFDTGSRDEIIPIVQENLRVGKRDVNNGSVKVRAYTVETPVTESLSLRDENVSIDRRPVDRALTDADRAFQDRTLSAEEHHEEAVVSKDARVVEEIGVRKTSADRTETINDTIRKTEVDVQDGRGQSQSQGSFGQRQTSGRLFASRDIQEHSEVVGSDGGHVGTVDHIEGSRIKLTKTDSKDGQHHYLGLNTVGSVDGNRVRLTVPANEALAQSSFQ
jgi:uncharacterized protein (TIGR02271 family)